MIWTASDLNSIHFFNLRDKKIRVKKFRNVKIESTNRKLLHQRIVLLTTIKGAIKEKCIVTYI